MKNLHIIIAIIGVVFFMLMLVFFTTSNSTTVAESSPIVNPYKIHLEDRLVQLNSQIVTYQIDLTKTTDAYNSYKKSINEPLQTNSSDATSVSDSGNAITASGWAAIGNMQTQLLEGYNNRINNDQNKIDQLNADKDQITIQLSNM